MAELGPTRVTYFGAGYHPDLQGKVQHVYGYPLDSYVSSHFGPRDPMWTPGGGTSDFHTGIDLVAPNGSPIYAPAPCEVVFSGIDTGGNHLVSVRFADGTGALFLHIDGWQAPHGAVLARGEVLGYLGSTGQSTGPHLHYMRVRQSRPGAYWYPREELIDPFTSEGGHVEVLSPDPAPILVRDVTVGGWPGADQPGLVAVVSGCSPREIVAEAASEGCQLASIWHLQGGAWRGYVVGAPDVVNASFPPALPIGIALYVRAAAAAA